MDCSANRVRCAASLRRFAPMDSPFATGHIDDVPNKREQGRAQDRDDQPHGYGDDSAGEPEERSAKNEEHRIDEDRPHG
jgi:hypothetical protein